jgi:hypothetical protein
MPTSIRMRPRPRHIRAIIPAAAVINAGAAEAWVAWEIIVWAVAALLNSPRA